jgi:hypothetical protein
MEVNAQTIIDLYDQHDYQEVVDLFNAYTGTDIDVFVAAYVSRDYVLFGHDTGSNQHKEHRSYIINKFRTYFNDNEVSSNLEQADSQNDVKLFYQCFTIEHFMVIGY